MALTIHPNAILNWCGSSDDADTARTAMLNDFDITDEEVGRVVVLAALYTYECWEGNAFVLFVNPDTGELFEVNGGHCSRNGLEGQWGPELTNFAALQMRKFDYIGSEKEKEAILELVWSTTNGDFPQGAA